LIPGTGEEPGRTVDAGLEPEIAARLLLAAIGDIERATTELQASGRLQTPFSADPEREREAVVQQTFWLYAAELSGEKYGRTILPLGSKRNMSSAPGCHHRRAAGRARTPAAGC
jgi:hypothetical protein